MLTRIFKTLLARPVTAAMGAAALCIFGAVSFFRMPMTLMPAKDAASLTVVIKQTGQSPESIEERITRPVEKALTKVQGIRSLFAASSYGECRLMAGHQRYCSYAPGGI